jgi:ketosteroid isomerase-like protein
MAEDNLGVIKGAYDAFGRGDIPAILETLSSDVEWNVPDVLPHRMHVRGRDGVVSFFERLGSLWEGLGLDLEDFVASGDRVCVIGKASGGYDGKQTGFGFVHAWTLRDGVVVRFDEYVDPAPELYR